MVSEMHERTSGRGRTRSNCATTTRHVDAGGSYEQAPPRPGAGTCAGRAKYSRGRGRPRRRLPRARHARRGTSTACRRCVARGRRRSNQYIRLPTTTTGAGRPRAPRLGGARRRPGRRKVAEAAAASGHGGVPLAAKAGGACQPARQEAAASTRGWTSCRALADKR
jgi:hypothetical protein